MEKNNSLKKQQPTDKSKLKTYIAENKSSVANQQEGSCHPPTKQLKRTSITTLLNNKLMVKVLELISQGIPIIKACHAVGVSREVYYGRLKTNKEFQIAVEQAQASYIQVHLDNIKKVAIESKQWAASAWLLERGFPEHFSNRSELRVKGMASKKKNKPTWFGAEIQDIEAEESKEEKQE